MGRIKDIVLKHYNSVVSEPNMKMERYQCKYCTQKYSYQLTRLTKHLKTCKGCPDDVKLKLPAENIASSQQQANSSDGDNNVTEEEEGNKNTLTRKMNKFVDFMPPQDQKKASELLSKAIYCSGSPLQLTTNVFWKEFFHFIRPAFKLPSRDAMSNSLLDLIYNQVQAEVQEKILNATYISIECDAWSNIRNEGIIDFVLHTPNPVFYKSIQVKNNSENANYVAQQIINVIDEIGKKKVISVCTDNAAVNKKAWELVENHYTDDLISFYGCSAHILNLLCKDILDQPSAADIFSSTKNVIKEIKQSHVLTAEFTDIQKKDEKRVKTTLKIPAKTRFGSASQCLESIYVNKHNFIKLTELEQANEYMSDETKQKILDEEFWFSIAKLLQLLKPILNWITILEDDDSKIYLVIEAFLDIVKFLMFNIM